MTEFYLIGVFFLCAAAGYLAVKKGAGFLEQILFPDSEVWYNPQGESCGGRRTKGCKVGIRYEQKTV